MCAGHNNLLLAAGGPVRRRPIAHGLVLRRARRRQQTMETAHKFGPLTLICLWCSSNSPRPPPQSAGRKREGGRGDFTLYRSAASDRAGYLGRRAERKL